MGKRNVIHTYKKHYSALKEENSDTHDTWRNLEALVLNKISQSQKETNTACFHFYNVLRVSSLNHRDRE